MRSVIQGTDVGTEIRFIMVTSHMVTTSKIALNISLADRQHIPHRLTAPHPTDTHPGTMESMLLG